MKKKIKKIPVKTNLSSTQVLKTFQMLMSGNYTMAELIQNLNVNEPEPIFNNSVVSKYICTCRFSGIEIHKINNRYYVTCLPFGIKITKSENDLIKYLQDCSNKLLSAKSGKIFHEFTEKLERFTDQQIINLNKETTDKICSIYEEAIKYERKIQLILKNKTVLECIPVDISMQNGKLYFHIQHNNKDKMILNSRISGVKILSDRFRHSRNDDTVVFRLFGNLAHNYNTRENENIITDNLPESLAVVNHGESRMSLLSRLLRYGDLCKIMTPKFVKAEMINIIDETLANYGE